MKQRLPALFIAHGTPMNAIEPGKHSAIWKQLAIDMAKPKAIVMISAHWYISATAVTAMQAPRTIHDFSGFPQELYNVVYPAPGDPELAQHLVELLEPIPVLLDQNQWGFDHGCWSILHNMYPEADIPVIQLSIDGTKDARFHYELGQKLAILRQQGVLLLASGNVVHNLSMLKWQGDTTAYPWAEEFDQYVQQHCLDDSLLNYNRHPAARLAVPTPEHFLPLLYILGARQPQDQVSFPSSGIEMGSLSMLSVKLS